MKYYAIYKRETDELLASGTAKECQQQMGFKTPQVFYCTVSRVYRGLSNKYEVYVSDDKEDDEDADVF